MYKVNLVTYLATLALLQFTNGAPASTLLATSHDLNERSAGDKIRVLVLMDTSILRLSVDESGNIKTSSPNDSDSEKFQKDAPSPGVINIRSIKYGYYIAVSEDGAVSAVSNDEISEGSGEQYNTDFTLAQSEIPGLSYLSSNKYGCKVNFSEANATCIDNGTPIYLRSIN